MFCVVLDAFYSSEFDQRHLLQKMIKAPNITLNILVDYCNDTHFDLQETAKLFLESLLIQWEPSTPNEDEEKTFGNQQFPMNFKNEYVMKLIAY